MWHWSSKKKCRFVVASSTPIMPHADFPCGRSVHSCTWRTRTHTHTHTHMHARVSHVPASSATLRLLQTQTSSQMQISSARAAGLRPLPPASGPRERAAAVVAQAAHPYHSQVIPKFPCRGQVSCSQVQSQSSYSMNQLINQGKLRSRPSHRQVAAKSSRPLSLQDLYDFMS